MVWLTAYDSGLIICGIFVRTLGQKKRKINNRIKPYCIEVMMKNSKLMLNGQLGNCKESIGDGAGKVMRIIRMAYRDIWRLIGTLLIAGGFIFGFDLIGSLFEDGITIVVEFVQQGFEIMYRKQFRLDLYHAQMATAYSCFIIFNVIVYLVIKRVMQVLGKVRSEWGKWWDNAMNLVSLNKRRIVLFWVDLDFINKIFLSVGVVVIVVPVLSLFCMGLGKMVAELI